MMICTIKIHDLYNNTFQIPVRSWCIWVRIWLALTFDLFKCDVYGTEQI